MVDLLQPEQVEMVNQERRDQNDQPSEPEQSLQHKPPRRVLHVPRNTRQSDWAPLPEHQQQNQASDQHVGAAFEQRRHGLSPSALEPRSSHYTVLDREQTQQERLDTHPHPPPSPPPSRHQA